MTEGIIALLMSVLGQWAKISLLIPINRHMVLSILAQHRAFWKQSEILCLHEPDVDIRQGDDAIDPCFDLLPSTGLKISQKKGRSRQDMETAGPSSAAAHTYWGGCPSLSSVHGCYIPSFAWLCVSMSGGSLYLAKSRWRSIYTSSRRAWTQGVGMWYQRQCIFHMVENISGEWVWTVMAKLVWSTKIPVLPSLQPPFPVAPPLNCLAICCWGWTAKQYILKIKLFEHNSGVELMGGSGHTFKPSELS